MKYKFGNYIESKGRFGSWAEVARDRYPELWDETHEKWRQQAQAVLDHVKTLADPDSIKALRAAMNSQVTDAEAYWTAIKVRDVWIGDDRHWRFWNSDYYYPLTKTPAATGAER